MTPMGVKIKDALEVTSILESWAILIISKANKNGIKKTEGDLVIPPTIRTVPSM